MDIEQIFSLTTEKEKDPATIRELAGNAMNFYNSQFKRELQKMIFIQLDSFVGKKGEEEFIRGTLNGLYLIDEWFQRQIGIIKNKEEEKL